MVIAMASRKNAEQQTRCTYIKLAASLAKVGYYSINYQMMHKEV